MRLDAYQTCIRAEHSLVARDIHTRRHKKAINVTLAFKMHVRGPIPSEGKVLQVLRISVAKCRGPEIDGIAMSNQLKISSIFSVHGT